MPTTPKTCLCRSLLRSIVLSSVVLLGAARIAGAQETTPAAAAATAAAGLATGEFQDIGQLEITAGKAAAPQFPALSDNQRLLVGPIPAQSHLKRCGRPVNSLIGPARHMNDRLLVELRCADSPGWHLYVPVKVVGNSSVVVAAHAIVGGSVFKSSDIRMEQHDSTQLPPGYLDDASMVVGLTAARGISSGSILTNQQIVAEHAVHRGQTVTLIADFGGVSVRMAGRALSDGLPNQRVRVQNLSSGKIVEGVARSEQLVEINFQ